MIGSLFLSCNLPHARSGHGGYMIGSLFLSCNLPHARSGHGGYIIIMIR